jgi:hypothetical protein
MTTHIFPTTASALISDFVRPNEENECKTDGQDVVERVNAALEELRAAAKNQEKD